MNKNYRHDLDHALDYNLTEVEHRIDNLHLPLDNILEKIKKLQMVTKNTKHDFKIMEKSLKKILSNFGRALGNNIIGRKQQAVKYHQMAVNSFLDLIPQTFAQMIAGKRAQGGAVMSNNAYLVGERGTELFIPNHSGHIIANDKIGNNKINIVMNINTLNADSFHKSQNQIITEAMSIFARCSRTL